MKITVNEPYKKDFFLALHNNLNKFGVQISRNKLSDTIQELKEVDGRLFNSLVKNRIPMNPTDPRIAKIGRNYLETNSLTIKQYKQVTKCFDELFELGIIAEKIEIKKPSPKVMRGE